jgi:hypothetical protein
MADDGAHRVRYGEAFWWAHHETWKRSDRIRVIEGSAATNSTWRIVAVPAALPRRALG